METRDLTATIESTGGESRLVVTGEVYANNPGAQASLVRKVQGFNKRILLLDLELLLAERSPLAVFAWIPFEYSEAAAPGAYIQVKIHFADKTSVMVDVAEKK